MARDPSWQEEDPVVLFLARDRDDASEPAQSAGAALSHDEQAELEELDLLLADPALWAEPPAGLEDRVVIAIAAERAGAATNLDPARSRRPAVRQRQWRRPALLVAAASIAVLAAAIIAVRLEEPSAQFTVALSSTELSPGATGSATLTRTDSGWNIQLTATGLPRLDGGAFYEAWLKDASGTLVPIGTFNEGSAVTLWAGVSPAEFGTLTVTREFADGHQASSGERVLVGEVEQQ